MVQLRQRSRRQLFKLVLAVSWALLALALQSSGSTEITTFLADQAKAMQRAHGQLEAAASKLGRPPRKVTLKEFLLDPSFVPPLVEYTVEETDGLHHARVAIGGTSHAGAPSSSREEAELSAALVALRSIRANSDEKRGHQDAIFRVPRGHNLRVTTKRVAGGKHASNLKWIQQNSGAEVSLLGGQGTGKPLSVKVSGDATSCKIASAMVHDLLALLPANVQTGRQQRRKCSIRHSEKLLLACGPRGRKLLPTHLTTLLGSALSSDQMKCFRNAVLSASAFTMGLGASYHMDYSSGASPVQKVVELMQTMVAEGKKEIQAEKVQYAKYSKWCEMTQAKKSQVISDTADAIDGLKADISKTSATIDRLTAENEGHQGNVAALVAQQENITQIRKKENEDFQAILKDYGESISALGNAIGVMKEQAYDRKQVKPEKAKASALLDEFTIQDLRTKAPGREMTTAVTALVESAKKPEVDGYEFQSKGVVELLKELEDKFIQEKADLEKAEFEKKAAYETTLAGLKNEQAAEQKDIGKKSALKSKKLQQKAELGNNLDTSESTKAADETYLQDITSTCSQKATDYAARQKLRAEELEAVDKAIEIIGGETVAGSEQKHLAKSFLQVSGTSLAALRANDARRAQAVIKERVAAFLQKEADRLHSVTLANLVAPTEESQSLGGVED
eukprot:s4539_g1.t3